MMTKDDILLALRMTAMGRAGHPLQEQLAEELAAVLAPKPEVVALPVVEPSAPAPAAPKKGKAK